MTLRYPLTCLAAALALWLSAAPALASPEDASAPLGATESYKLPISPPRDQGDSGLCWAFATLSMLESNYMHAHPGARIALSHGALQRVSFADRLGRLASGGPAYLDDGGIAVDAISLIRGQGLVAAADFHDVLDADTVFARVKRRLDIAPSAAKTATADRALTDEAGALPQKTHLDGRALSPADLAKSVLGDRVWAEYDVASDGVARVGPSDDPDARPGARVHYAPLSTLVDLVHRSLKRGEAVVWGSNDNHALVIFGADYDSDGRPLDYWIKDSFAPYVYRAPAATIHSRLTDVTVAMSPDEERTASKN